MENSTLFLTAAGLLLGAGMLSAQPAPPSAARLAGACARCHVSPLLEWDISKHASAGIACIGCHGSSKAHVLDERNSVKPDRIPRGAAIASLCASCHSGCPKTKRADGCQDCHHVHALLDARQPASPPPAPRVDAAQYRAAMDAGEAHVRAGRWRDAEREFDRALELRPADTRATLRLDLARRRLHPAIAGFRPLTPEIDAGSGLPLAVETDVLHLRMLLVRGGDANLGGDAGPESEPAHSVRVDSFYLGQSEVTQRQWVEILGTNPSRFPTGGDEPVENISWLDCQEFLRRLNGRIAGGGFRLPTEAEWEFAARANASKNAARLGNTTGRPKRAGSASGFHNLMGNVWEWCSSLFLPYPYDAGDGREAAAGGGLRVLRGGGYADPADRLRPGLRFGERPNRRLPWNGLRIARSVTAPPKSEERSK